MGNPKFRQLTLGLLLLRVGYPAVADHTEKEIHTSFDGLLDQWGLSFNGHLLTPSSLYIRPRTGDYCLLRRQNSPAFIGIIATGASLSVFGAMPSRWLARITHKLIQAWMVIAHFFSDSKVAEGNPHSGRRRDVLVCNWPLSDKWSSKYLELDRPIYPHRLTRRVARAG